MIKIQGVVTIQVDLGNSEEIRGIVRFLQTFTEPQPQPPLPGPAAPVMMKLKKMAKNTRQAGKKRAYHKKVISAPVQEKKPVPVTTAPETVAKESVTRKPLKLMTPEEIKAKKAAYMRAWYLKHHPEAKVREHKHPLSEHQQKMEENRAAEDARIDAIATEIKEEAKCDNEMCPMRNIGNWSPDPRYIVRTKNPKKKYCTLSCAEEGIQRVGGEIV